MRYGKCKKSLVRQQDVADCGPACLASIFRYHDHPAPLEEIRQLSGTRQWGSSMLGMYRTAIHYGFEAHGLATSGTGYLKSLAEPAILYVTKGDEGGHFVVYYGMHKGKALIGDPSRGLRACSLDELEKNWASGKLLLIKKKPRSAASAKPLHASVRTWLSGLLQKDQGMLVLILFTGIMGSALNLAQAFFSRFFVDNLLPSKDLPVIYVSLLLLLIILFFNGLLHHYRRRILLQQGVDFNKRMLKGFFFHLLQLPVSFFENRQTGSLLARLNDCQRIQQSCTALMGEMGHQLLTILACLGGIAWLSPAAAFALLPFIPATMVVYLLNENAIRRNQQESMAAQAVREDNYIQSIQHIHLVKANPHPHFFYKNGLRIFSCFQHCVKKLGETGSRMIWANDMLAVGGFVLLMLVLIPGLVNGSTPLGTLIALLSLTGKLFPALAGLAYAGFQIQEALVALERMKQIMEAAPEFCFADERKKKDTGHIRSLQIERVGFSHPGQEHLLREISCLLQQGISWSIYGPNGSGKSSLLKLIMGFYHPSGGQILVNGQPLQACSLPAYRKQIGLVPQEVSLFNGSIIDNLFPGQAGKSVSDLPDFLLQSGLLDAFAGLPQELRSLVGERGLKLSGGQRKLIGLCRALMHQPRLLLLDELFASMDQATACRTHSLINQLKHDSIILMVNHEVRHAAITDRIILLDQGRLSGSFSHDELISFPNAYRKAWKMEAAWLKCENFI